MSVDYVGSLVSLSCGDVLGTYQGRVTRVDHQSQTLTIEQAYRNGVICSVPNITINAADIHDLRILKTTVEDEKKPPTAVDYKPKPSHSPMKSVDSGSAHVKKTAAHQQAKSSSRASPRADLYTHGATASSKGHRNSPEVRHTNAYRQRNNSVSDLQPVNGNQRGASPEVRHNGYRQRNSSLSDSQPVNANKRGYSTPRKNEQRKKRDDCFSAPVDTFANEEFDFEKNLALFNKQAVFEEIENQGYSRAPRAETKFKNDENVLPSEPTEFSRIKVPGADDAASTLVTDSGLVVPCIAYDTRRKLFEEAETCGYSLERQIETVGRSASEMVLQLIGGSHRLTPQNAHQRPSVVVLCGPHVQGAQGVNCARHLAAHNVRVSVFLPSYVRVLKELEGELALYRLSDGSKTSNPKDLPAHPVDIIVNALDSHDTLHLGNQTWYQALVSWANQNKAPVLGVDPPVGGGPIDMKWSLSVCLPLPLSLSCGQVYLCDLSLPQQIFANVDIKYTSPFAHKYLVPLHRN